MSGPPGHGNALSSIHSLASQAPSQASWVTISSVLDPVETSAAESSHSSRSSVSSAPPQTPTLPLREDVDQGHAWVQPLKAVIFFPSDTRTLDPPFQSLSKEETEDLFYPKGLLDPNRRVYLAEGQPHRLACFCRFTDVDCEPKRDADHIMFYGNLPQQHSPYIYYTCQRWNCRCRWAMKMPTSVEDLASLQKDLRSYEDWEAIQAETPGAVRIVNLLDHHNFLCSALVRGCGSEIVKCRRIESKCTSECRHLSKEDRIEAHKTSFLCYKCEKCNYTWTAREPATRVEWKHWEERRESARRRRDERTAATEKSGGH